MNALEHRARACGSGVEPATKRRVLLLECADALANTRRLRIVGRAVEIAEPLFGGERPLAIAGELLAEVAHEPFQLAERFDVRSCVLGHPAVCPDGAPRSLSGPRSPSR